MLTNSGHRPPVHASAWARGGALAVLMVLTSLAVASVSVWLVIPYVALMASILFVPFGVREETRDLDGETSVLSRHAHVQGRGEELADDRTVAMANDDDEAAERTSDRSAIEPGTGLEANPDEDPASEASTGSRAVKAKRGKGRARKAKAVDETPGTGATWIKIGPGKFVRAEPPGPPAVAGPSSSFPFPAPEGEREEGIEAEARAIPAPDEPRVVEPVPEENGGGNPDVADGPEADNPGSPEAVDAALASPQEAPPYVGDPAEFFASLSGIGEGPAGEPSTGDAMVATEVEVEEEERALVETDADEPASTTAGGDPGQAWEPDLAAESTGVMVMVDVLGSDPDPDAPLPAVVEVDYGPVPSEAEMARDAEDQALADVAEAWAAEVDSPADPGMDAYLEGDPGAVADVSRDNGIAPDAFDAPSTDVEIAREDATPRDLGEEADATEHRTERPGRPTVGKLLNSFRGRMPWLRGVPSTRAQSALGAPSGRRASRIESRRSPRALPGPRRPTRRTTVRSRQACRHFPPRSPPVPSRRS